jgi:hypothetical protein
MCYAGWRSRCQAGTALGGDCRVSCGCASPLKNELLLNSAYVHLCMEKDIFVVKSWFYWFAFLVIAIAT